MKRFFFYHLRNESMKNFISKYLSTIWKNISAFTFHICLSIFSCICVWGRTSAFHHNTSSRRKATRILNNPCKNHISPTFVCFRAFRMYAHNGYFLVIYKNNIFIDLINHYLPLKSLMIISTNLCKISDIFENQNISIWNINNFSYFIFHVIEIFFWSFEWIENFNQ